MRMSPFIEWFRFSRILATVIFHENFHRVHMRRPADPFAGDSAVLAANADRRGENFQDKSRKQNFVFSRLIRRFFMFVSMLYQLFSFQAN